MLLNFLWFGLILLAFVSDLLTGMPFSSGMDGLSGARAGLELALTLAGVSRAERRRRDHGKNAVIS